MKITRCTRHAHMRVARLKRRPLAPALTTSAIGRLTDNEARVLEAARRLGPPASFKSVIRATGIDERTAYDVRYRLSSVGLWPWEAAAPC